MSPSLFSSALYTIALLSLTFASWKYFLHVTSPAIPPTPLMSPQPPMHASLPSPFHTASRLLLPAVYGFFAETKLETLCSHPMYSFCSLSWK